MTLFFNITLSYNYIIFIDYPWVGYIRIRKHKYNNKRKQELVRRRWKLAQT